jgi:hypothetical protein
MGRQVLPKKTALQEQDVFCFKRLLPTKKHKESCKMALPDAGSIRAQEEQIVPVVPAEGLGVMYKHPQRRNHRGAIQKVT